MAKKKKKKSRKRKLKTKFSINKGAGGLLKASEELIRKTKKLQDVIHG